VNVVQFYTTWARGIIQKNWGHHIKCFLAARKRFKCENPTEAQIQMVKDSREINNITEEYAKTAMVTGKVVRSRLFTSSCPETSLTRNIADGSLGDAMC
jgi:hypothetical protein